MTDDREKKPLVFPKHIVCLDTSRPIYTKPTTTVTLLNVTERLNGAHPECHKGDYYMKGYPNAVVIERKGSIQEVSENCLSRRRRNNFIAELRYLQNTCTHPILLMEGVPRTILSSSMYCPVPEVAVDALLDLLMQHRIQFLLIPNSSTGARRAMGELAARLLIRGALNYG